MYYWDWGTSGGANWMVASEIGGTNRYLLYLIYVSLFPYLSFLTLILTAS
jgi:hypothetical protein